MSALGDGLLGFVGGAVAGADSYIAEERKNEAEFDKAARLESLRQQGARDLAAYQNSLRVSSDIAKEERDQQRGDFLRSWAVDYSTQTGRSVAVSDGQTSIGAVPSASTDQDPKPTEAQRVAALAAAARAMGIDPKKIARANDPYIKDPGLYLDGLLTDNGGEDVVSIIRYANRMSEVRGLLDDLHRKATNGPAGGATSGGVIKVSSPEEAALLAPGTVYETPDGRRFSR